MSDENERSVASDGSVAGSLADGLRGISDSLNVVGNDFSDILYPAARELERLSRCVKELEARVVRLPSLDPNGAPGWNAAIGAVREALAEAGVDWDTE